MTQPMHGVLKSHKTRAVAAIIPAITTAGIYPGVNNGAVIFIILM